MKDKKFPFNLFTWRHVIYLSVAIILGASLATYRNYEQKGYLDVSDLIIAILAVITGFAIMISVVYYANRPEKRN